MPLPGTGGSQRSRVTPTSTREAPGPVRQHEALVHSPPKGLRHFSRMRDSAARDTPAHAFVRIVSLAPFGTDDHRVRGRMPSAASFLLAIRPPGASGRSSPERGPGEPAAVLFLRLS